MHHHDLFAGVGRIGLAAQRSAAQGRVRERGIGRKSESGSQELNINGRHAAACSSHTRFVGTRCEDEDDRGGYQR
jgi:hypothetical protein